MNAVLKVNQISRLRELDYTVFHGPTFAFYTSELHQRIFTEWKMFWEKHFEETDRNSTLFSDDLLRTTYVLVLHKKETPIGILFSSIWNLSNSVHQYSRYISQYPKQAREQFKLLHFDRVLSLEYLSVNPDWRFQKTQLPVSEILLGLGLKFFHQNTDLDGTISIARRIVKVQERMAQWGMREVVDMTLHNNACTVTLCGRKDYKAENPDPTINHFTNYFLNKRTLQGFPESFVFQGGSGLKAA